MDSYYKKYIKYKLKYNNLKYQVNVQFGGNLNNEIDNHLDTLGRMITQIENSFNNNLIEQLLIQLNKINKYIETNDIPVSPVTIDTYQLKNTMDSIDKLKSELNFANLFKLYEIRKKVYLLESNNMNEILDYLIEEFRINNEKSINDLFMSPVLGFNKNYIIYWMVLLRFLIVNNKQLSTLDNPIPFLTPFSINQTLNSELNSDEYIELLVQLINEYIRKFPIKKIIIINQSSYFDNKAILQSNPHEPIQKIRHYNVKNNIIEYESGQIKETNKANFDDLKQILFTLFRIPVYVPKN